MIIKVFTTIVILNDRTTDIGYGIWYICLCDQRQYVVESCKNPVISSFAIITYYLCSILSIDHDNASEPWD